MDTSPSFLRPAAVLAGSLGVVQSLIWMALSITGIVAYYCNLDFDGQTASMGSITGLTIFQLYFRGTCTPPNLPVIDFGVFSNLNLMRSLDIHAWVWVYLMISFFWFISSCTLLSHVKSRYIRWANIFLYFWIAITLAISILDLVLGILFGLDYERVMNAANTAALFPEAGAAVGNSHLLIAGQAAIGTLFSIVLRGYLLWLLNIVLVVFLFTQTLLVSDYNRMAPFRRAAAAGASNSAYEEETPRKPHPIEAFGSKDTANLWYSPPSPTPTHQQMQPQQQQLQQQQLHAVGNGGTSVRGPLHHSRSVFEERKQFYNDLSRSSVPRVVATARSHTGQPEDTTDIQYRQKKVVNELNQRNSQMPQQLAHAVPDPDYSPPMPRVNPFDQRRTQQRTGF